MQRLFARKERVMDKIIVMIAGLSTREGKGKMARLMAEAILAREDMQLFTFGMAEGRGDVSIGTPARNECVRLIQAISHEELLNDIRGAVDMVVDFTQPESVVCNAQRYCRYDMPFVMGTTGGDRKKLVETVTGSEIVLGNSNIIPTANISAVIATNMAVPVVIFQEMIKFAAKNFPEALRGSKFLVQESHQSGKSDPSGTAVSLLPFFEKLGLPYTGDQIVANGMERDPLVQELVLGVPPENLGGHGYHGYFIRSPSGSVDLRFEHNIRGRNDYVDGALRAIRFLARQKGVKGKVFSMVDVLRG